MPESGGATPDDVFDDIVPGVSKAAARKIIAATKHPQVAKGARPEPDEDKLALGIRTMMEEFRQRHVVESLLSYKDLLHVSGRALSATLDATSVINRAFTSVDFRQYFLSAGECHQDSTQMELAQKKVRALTEDLLPWLTKRLKTVIRDLTLEQEGGSRGKRVDLGMRARDWIYDFGIPELFTSTFGTRFSSADGGGASTPGGRFAEAVLREVRIPLIAPGTLRNRQRFRRKRESQGSK